MKVSFSTKKLEKILTNERILKRHYAKIYKNIMNRMSEIKAVNNLNEIPHIPPPRRHKLDGDLNNCWGIDVSKNFRLIIRPSGEWIETDLKTIIEIEILKVEDYH